MMSRSSARRDVESRRLLLPAVGGFEVGVTGAAGFEAPNVEMEKSFPSLMTLPQPKPEPGVSVTADLVGLSAVSNEFFLFSSLDIASVSADPYGEIFSTLRELPDLLWVGKSGRPFFDENEFFLTKAGRGREMGGGDIACAEEHGAYAKKKRARKSQTE